MDLVLASWKQLALCKKNFSYHEEFYMCNMFYPFSNGGMGIYFLSSWQYISDRVEVSSDMYVHLLS